MNKDKKGFFVSFEGADGVGKTTQINLLIEYLKDQNRTSFATREPGGTVVGEKVRNILLDPDIEMVKRTETLLYLAARAEHVENIILPKVEDGIIVLSDRFSDSTLVYQGIARGLGIDTLIKINDFATNGLLPNLTFLLDAPVEELAKRMQKRGKADRIEQEGLKFQQLVRDGFLALAKRYPERIVVIDALQSIEKMQEFIQENIYTKLLKDN